MSCGGTVTVTGVNDPGLGDRRAVVTHWANGGGYDLTDTVTVTVTDDGAAELVLSDTSVTVSEAGGTATYALALSARPTDTVTVLVESSDTSTATVSPPTFTFTVTNWDVMQAVTVTGGGRCRPRGPEGSGHAPGDRRWLRYQRC